MIYQLEIPAAVLTQERPLRLVQCSDMHLFADPDSKLLGLNTQHSFQSVVDLIQQQQPSIDLLLTTGDIAQQSVPETYQRFLHTVQPLQAAHFCIPGNHDLNDAYHAGLLLNQLPCEVILGNWCCILLDSTIDHEIAGSFSHQTLDYLQQALQRQRNRHVLLALHHNPIAVGCEWLDQHLLKASQSFFDILRPFDNIKLVLHGHVHQIFEKVHEQVSYLSCPATSLQFKPRSAKFTLDSTNPGYRWLDLYANGYFETDVCRVKESNFFIDYQSDGY